MQAGYWAAGLAAVLAGSLLGDVCHELLHYATARTLGLPARLTVSLTQRMRVEYDPTVYSRRVAPLASLLVDVTPTVTGLTLLAVWLYGSQTPVIVSPTVLGVCVAWLWLTLPSRDDLSPPSVLSCPREMP